MQPDSIVEIINMEINRVIVFLIFILLRGGMLILASTSLPFTVSIHQSITSANAHNKRNLPISGNLIVERPAE